MTHIEERLDRVNCHPADHRGFLGIEFGNNDAGNFASAGLDGNGKSATNAADVTVQRKFSHEQTIINFLLI